MFSLSNILNSKGTVKNLYFEMMALVKSGDCHSFINQQRKTINQYEKDKKIKFITSNKDITIQEYIQQYERNLCVQCLTYVAYKTTNSLNDLLEFLLSNGYVAPLRLYKAAIRDDSVDVLEYIYENNDLAASFCEMEEPQNSYLYLAIQNDAVKCYDFLLEHNFLLDSDCYIAALKKDIDIFATLLQTQQYSEITINLCYCYLIEMEDIETIAAVKQLTNIDFNLETYKVVIKKGIECIKAMIALEKNIALFAEALLSYLPENESDYFKIIDEIEKEIDVEFSKELEFNLCNMLLGRDSRNAFKHSIKFLKENGYNPEAESVEPIDQFFIEGTNNIELITAGDYIRKPDKGYKNYPIGYTIKWTEIGWKGTIALEKDQIVYKYTTKNGTTFQSHSPFMFPNAVEDIRTAWGFRIKYIEETLNKKKETYEDAQFTPTGYIYFSNYEANRKDSSRPYKIPLYYNGSRDIPYEKFLCILQGIDDFAIETSMGIIRTSNSKELIRYNIYTMSDTVYVEATLRSMELDIKRKKTYSILDYSVTHNVKPKELFDLPRVFIHNLRATFKNPEIIEPISLKYMSDSTIRRDINEKFNMLKAINHMEENGQAAYKFSIEVRKDLLMKDGQTIISFTWVSDKLTQDLLDDANGFSMDTTFKSLKPYVYIIPHLIIHGTGYPIGLSVGFKENAALYTDFLHHLIRLGFNFSGKYIITDGLQWFSDVAMRFNLIPLKCAFHKLRSFGCAKHPKLLKLLKKIIYSAFFEEEIKVILIPQIQEELRNSEISEETKAKIEHFIFNDKELQEHCMYARIESGMPMTTNISESPHRVLNSKTKYMRRSDKKLNMILEEIENLQNNFDERNERAYLNHVRKMRKRQEKLKMIWGDDFQQSDEMIDEIYYTRLFGRDAPGIYSNMEGYSHVTLSRDEKCDKGITKLIMEEFGEKYFTKHEAVISRVVYFFMKSNLIRKF